MSGEFNFNDAFILGPGLGELDRPSLLEMAREICRALMDTEGSCHGNINPFNISRSPQGEVGLGPVADHAPGDWNSDELEYMAPELFWNREGDAAADVYSVGMLIFAGISGGRLPFFPEGTVSPEPEERAGALRKRMSGEDFDMPPAAGPELGAILKKALSYKKEKRYSGPVEMLSVLSECPDEEDVPDAPPAVLPAEGGERPEYKVDKSLEEPKPEKPERNLKPAIIVVCICAALLVVALAAYFFTRGNNDEPGVSATPDAHTGISETASPSPGLPDETDPSAEPADPTATPEPTPEPSELPTIAAESRYELYIEDVSWTDAAERCEELGGHLVTISDAAELKKVTDLAEANGVNLVWIGFYRSVAGVLTWVNDEDISYYNWKSGEPSVTDLDGTPENYGLLWHYGNRTGWVYNDSRNDPVSEFPSAYSGKIAFVCEFYD